MVARLRPGVGKEDVHSGQRGFGDHVLQDFDGIVLNDALVAEAVFCHQLAQAADARRVHFDTEIVVFGMRCGNCRRGFTHAEADLEDARCVSSENVVQIEPGGRVGNADLRHHRFVIALLGIRDTALPQHEAANRAMPGGFLRFFQKTPAYEPIRPVVGDEGSAE